MIDNKGAPDLKALREAKGWTVADAAKQLGVSLSTIYQWERNFSAPSYGSAVKISKVYGVPCWRKRAHEYAKDPALSDGSFAHWINENQKKCGLSVYQLSKEAFLSISYLYFLKEGRYIPQRDKPFIELVCTLHKVFLNHGGG